MAVMVVVCLTPVTPVAAMTVTVFGHVDLLRPEDETEDESHLRQNHSQGVERRVLVWKEKDSEKMKQKFDVFHHKNEKNWLFAGNLKRNDHKNPFRLFSVFQIFLRISLAEKSFKKFRRYCLISL